MKLEMDQKIIDEANQCTKGHRCLSGAPEDLCDAEIQLMGEPHFFCKNPEACSYKVPFAHNSFCTCPLRRAIYDKYEQ